MSPAPYPSLRVRFAVAGVAREAIAVVDTGFEGSLVVPESLIGVLPEPDELRRYRTASGESVVAVAYDEPSSW